MADDTRDVRAWLVERVATYLRRAPEDVDTSVALTEYGLDSLTALALSADLEDRYDLELDPALAWDHPTIDALAAKLTELIGARP
ncbi:acyl carrier protein [Actinosynnema sp. NPDC020468]|uniref:acyl carrier protein n=1 Tax=Actinosynnema sp. NPDC020468 TaxID=3154488 RepID=UPI0033FAE63E